MSHDSLMQASQQNKRRLAFVFFLTTAYIVVEVIGGILTKSLALLADAGHMMTDAGAIGLSLLAIRFSERPSTPRKTFGYYRGEILAAAINALILLGISFYILYEAWQRFQAPPVIASWPMLGIATVGLGVNLVGLWLLKGGAQGSLNVRGAYLEVMSDALGSLGVIIAAAIMATTGWYLADPIVSAGIGLFILPRTWNLLKQAFHILMEGTPAHIDLTELEKAIRSVPGVKNVHDLHVWTITSGFDAMSGHVVVPQQQNVNDVLAAVNQLLRENFGIKHTTIQVENEIN